MSGKNRAALQVLSSTEGVTMKHNIGTIDRVLRILVGVVLIALAATGTIGWWGWIGVVPLLTGLVRTCPAYSLLGVNSCGVKSAGK